MLQGTFETLSLPEVLGLLASARKSGALWLEAGPIAGVVHLDDGHCHAAVAGELRVPVETGPSSSIRLVDVCFAIMCQESGSFRFAADDPAPWSCPEPVELERRARRGRPPAEAVAGDPAGHSVARLPALAARRARGRRARDRPRAVVAARRDRRPAHGPRARRSAAGP